MPCPCTWQAGALAMSCISIHQCLFLDRVSLSCPRASLWSQGRSWTRNPSALTSQVAGITGLCHQAQVYEWFYFLNLMYQCPIMHTHNIFNKKKCFEIFYDILWSKSSTPITLNNAKWYMHSGKHLTTNTSFHLRLPSKSWELTLTKSIFLRR